MHTCEHTGPGEALTSSMESSLCFLSLLILGFVRSCIRHYWQNGGMAPTPSRHPAGLVILTCFFLSSVELAGKNVKVLIVFERSMRKHKAFCSCAQKIIYKVTIDIYSRIFTKNVPGWSPRPQLEAMGRMLFETCLWGECLWQRKFAELRV